MCGMHDPFALAPPPTTPSPPCVRVRAIAHHADVDCLAVLLADGSAALCHTDAAEASALGTFQVAAWLLGAGAGACVAAVSAHAQMLAVGCTDGVTHLWTLGGDWAAAPARELSLSNWGYRVEHTGAVAALDWAPDGTVRGLSDAHILHEKLW